MKRFKKIVLIVAVLITGISILFGYKDKSVEELKVKYAPAPSAFVSIEGMNVHYRDEGIASDTLPIVLLHGTGASLHTFDEWTKELKTKKRVLRMDLPGFGLTGSFPDRDYSIDHYVSFIENFLISNKISKCILAGNSLGGQIAWEFTAANPEMVADLILIDAAGYPLYNSKAPIAFTIARKPVLNKLMTFITPKFMARSSIENVYYDKSKVTDEIADRYFDLTLRAGNRQALVDRLRLTTDSNRVSKLKAITQPTLILWGKEDKLIPIDCAYRFRNDLTNGSLVILDKSGHVPMEENPKESLNTVLAFLKL